MNIKEIEKCLSTEERIDANTWFEEKGYRYATQTFFWEYPHELVFSGNVIKTQWYEDPLANDCVQSAIFTNVKGFEDYEFIILARVKNKDNNATASMFLYTNAPARTPVKYISPYGEKHSIFCYHQLIYLDYKNTKEN